jgi:hypothetical protein
VFFSCFLPRNSPQRIAIQTGLRSKRKAQNGRGDLAFTRKEQTKGGL